MRRGLFCLIFCVVAAALFLGVAAAVADETGQAPGVSMADQAQINSGRWSTVDHSKFDVLKQKFTTGEDVTKACLSCHTEAEKQIHKVIHWTWLSPTGGGLYGKAGYSINNFCISTNKMHDDECENCHIGWEKKKDGINCLKCHNTSSIDWRQEFKDLKEALDSGDPDWSGEIENDIIANVSKIALPQRRNCGECHFNGGGGEGVKHGDLDGSLVNPKKSLDVHMGIDGQDFTCTRCHTTMNHLVAGRVYSTPATGTIGKRVSLVQNDLAPKIACESCHTDKPHGNALKLDDHTDRVACQTCHIPTFARAHSTQMEWYWETAGKTDNGRVIQRKGPYGRPVYKSIKGDFVWKKNVKPEYFWYNGSIKSLTLKDVIDPSTEPVWISKPVGSPSDKHSRIAPFKVHRGSQPYDMETGRFLAPLLSEEDNGYWKTLDWKDSLTRGMKLIGLPYSGKMGFVKTCYVMPTTHMVAPKEDALSCIECHTRSGSRMAGIAGVYMPGRDSFMPLDVAGWGGALLALIAIALHAIGRIVMSAARRKEDK